MMTTDTVQIAPWEEKNLIDRVLLGETEAFEHLLRPCVAPMQRFAIRVLGNVADAEEAVQMAALRAYSHLATFRRESRFATWFYQIARNEIYQVRRKNFEMQRRFKIAVDDENRDLSHQWPDSRPSQLEVLERQQLAEGLEELIGFLPEGLREAFLLNCVEGLSIRETAERMALSIAAVKSRVFRARRFLRLRDQPVRYAMLPPSRACMRMAPRLLIIPRDGSGRIPAETRL
jgi:RNA polymerase sigma-70 factor (ECF subfamily)